LAVLALFAVREPPRESGRSRGTRRQEAGCRCRCFCAIALFTLGNSTDALLILRAQMLGVPTVQLPLLWALAHLVRTLLSWPTGRAADKLGRRRTLLAGWLWYAICYAGFALARAPWHAWMLFGAYALSRRSPRALSAR